jgi:glycosyltransferase involved in cell wall biosynthesis
LNQDVSIIVTAHHEGRLAHPTMRSVFRTAAYANEHGIKTEVIVVLDKPDGKTENYFKTFHNDGIIYTSDFGDPALSRNYGVSIAKGKYIAFLDGDDLFGRQWITEAYSQAESNIERCVYYPEYVVFFESENIIVKYSDMSDVDTYPANMIEFNTWNSVHFLAERSLLIENQFVPTPPGSGFGYEDWHWYCEIISNGIPLKIVSGTCIFYRKKASDSRLTRHNDDHSVIPPSSLFEPLRFSSIIK